MIKIHKANSTRISEVYLLIENRQDWVLQNLGKKITDVAEEEKRVGAYTGNTDAQQVVNILKQADPENGKNLVWICNMYIKKEFHLEDVPRIRNDLTTFKQNIAKIQNKDLNSYKDIVAFNQAIQPFQQNPQPVEKSANQQEKEYKRLISTQMEMFINTPNFKVYIPKTEEASCYIGRGTRWCTAATEADNRFDYYNSRGKLYSIITKLNGKSRKFQFHVENKEFKVEDDTDLINHPDDIAALSKLPEYTNFLNILIKKYYFPNDK